jgi:outer membrane protein
MKLRYAIVALPLALATEPSAAWKLEDVLRTGLQGNLDNRTQELSGDLAKARIEQARNAFLPTLRASAGLTHTWKKPVLEGTAQGYRWNAEAGLTLSQTLYSAQALTGVAIARQGRELDRLASRVQREALLAQLTTLYWNIAWLEENRASLRDSRTNLERIAQTVQAMVNNGVARRSDINSAHLAVRGVDASIELLDQQIAAQKNALCNAMGLEPDSSLTLADSLDTDAAPDDPMAPDLPSSLKLAQEQVRAKELEAALAADARMPSVTAFAKYGTQGNSERFDLVDKSKERFSDNGTVGIQVDVPLLDGGAARSGRAIARLERRQLEIEVARQKLSRTTGMLDARSGLETARSQVARQRENETLARENFRMKEEEHRQQVASLADLLRAESEVIASRSSLSEARYRERLARLELERALGQLSLRAQ